MMAAIFWMSSIPGTAEEHDNALAGVIMSVPPQLQNLLHIPLYAALAGAWCWSLRAWSLPATVIVAIGLSITLGFGLLDEYHQTFVPGRYGTTGDAALNLLGALIGAWYFRRFMLPERSGSEPPLPR